MEFDWIYRQFTCIVHCVKSRALVSGNFDLPPGTHITDGWGYFTAQMWPHISATQRKLPLPSPRTEVNSGFSRSQSRAMYNPENFLNLSLALNLKAVNSIFSILMISGGGSLSDLIFQNLSKGGYSSSVRFG